MYNHAFDIAFEVRSEDPEDATAEEILNGLQKRLFDLLSEYLTHIKENRPGYPEIMEACGAPFDTYEEEK